MPGLLDMPGLLYLRAYFKSKVEHFEKCSKNVKQIKFWEWAGLVGNMFAHPVGVFLCYLEVPGGYI